MSRLYALVDAARFYASVSTQCSPELRAKPLVVTTHSGYKGVPIALNQAASSVGVTKFTPLWRGETQKRLEVNAGTIVSANFDTFGHASARFMASVIAAAGSGIDGAVSHMCYSVDELFLSIDYNRDLAWSEYANEIRKTVWKEQRIGSGVAIAPTLTLAKSASYAAKKLDGYSGVCVIVDPDSDDCLTILKQQPVEDVWNVGKRSAEKLHLQGIKTAFELRSAPVKDIQKSYGINLANVVSELNGIAVLELDYTQSNVAARNQNDRIFSTKSYKDRLVTRESIEGQLAHHCEEVSQKARFQNAEVSELHAFVMTSRHDSQIPPFFAEKTLRFEPTVDSSVLLKHLARAYGEIIPESPEFQPIYKLGVGATKLTHEVSKQFDMFASACAEKSELMSTIDALNAKFGRVLKFARSEWSADQQDEQGARIPHFYTDIREIPTFEC
ncbi:DUF4113 domain-containing protein [Vibrio maritimus]|uniref:Y-family DNA polymerase n=1 Tax=Vibrio maritimus TaxID=990268 RepID=UPI0040680C6A